MDHDHKEKLALAILEDHINREKSFIFDLVSNHSMDPFLLQGDRIVSKNTPVNKLIPGDLVICRSGSNFYIHRFLYKRRIKNSGYLLITKGDNMLDPDTPLQEERLIGRAAAIQRAGRTMSLESILWKIANYALAIISLFQVYILRILLFVKNIFYKSGHIPFTGTIKRILKLPMRSTALFLRLFTL